MYVLLGKYHDCLRTFSNLPERYEPHAFRFENVFRSWFKRLYRFSPVLQLHFDRLLKLAKPSPDSKLFCAQVRIGGKPVDGNNIRKDLEFMKVDKAADYWNYIDRSFIKNNTDYKIFLTSDNQEVIENARAHFDPGRLVTNTNNVFHYNLQKRDRKCKEAVGLFVDFLMLSECDMGALSHSGFGMVPLLRKEPSTWKFFFVYSSPSFWTRKNGSFFERKNLTLRFMPFQKDFFYVHGLSSY